MKPSWTSLFCLLLVGCAKTSPTELRVAADDPAIFANWRAHAGEDVGPERWHQFDAAVRELRFACVAVMRGAPPDDVQQALCARVNGKTMAEVLVLGDEAKLGRLQDEWTELEDQIRTNGYLITRPGESDKAAQLEVFRAHQRERLRQVADEFGQTAASLRAKGRSVSAAKPVAASVALSRIEARSQFTEWFERRRGAAVLAYGAWPLRIDREGSRLPPEDRASFLERRAAANRIGHVLIPVKVKGRWWFFDAAEQLPGMDKFLTANFNPDDRAWLTRAWFDTEAECWARAQAADVDPPAESSDPFRPGKMAAPAVKPEI